MTELPRKRRFPSLAEYLAEPERFPTVAGRPTVPLPRGMVGPAPPSLGEILDDPRTYAAPLRSVVERRAAPAPPPQLPDGPPRRGFEPPSAPGAPQGDDLDAEWSAALSRAREAIALEGNFGLQSQASRWARLGPRPEPPRRPAPNPAMTAFMHNPVSRFIRSRSDPLFVNPELAEADRRAAQTQRRAR